MHNYKLSWLVALSVLGAASLARAETEKVGIALATQINVTEEQSALVVESLAEALESELEVQVVRGAEANAKLPEEARSETCLSDSTCLVNAGKALEVDALLMLIVVGVGDQVKIEATWVHVADQKTALRPAIDAPFNAEALREAFRKEAATLVPDATPRPKAAPAEEVSEPSGSEQRGDGAISTPMQPEPRDTGRHADGVTKALAIGGGTLLVASWATAAFIYKKKCDGDTDACSASTDTWKYTADGVAIVGAGLLSYAAFRYFTSAPADEAPPVALNVGSEHVGLSFGGRF